MSEKTGSLGRPWVKRDTTQKPPPVKNIYDYWQVEPLFLSERCEWWVTQIENGWIPNRSRRMECDECNAHWFGVWVWEMRNIIWPAVEKALENG